MLRSVVLSLMLVASAGPIQADTKSLIGNHVADFTLPDFRGKQHRLSDLKNQKLVVIAFVGVECPLAKLYAPRLVKLAEEFTPRGVAFLGVDANTQDSITSIAAFARIHSIPFPVLKDLGNHVADQMGALRTPEVFVLDDKHLIRYHGRIDDQYGIGFSRDKARNEELKDALNALLDGKPVRNPQTAAPGCFIGRARVPNDDSAVTFSKHIAPIFNRRCLECHRTGEIAPFALTSYREAAGWADTIAEVVAEGRMPPWHADPKFGKFANDCRLTDDEKRQIRDWVKAGAPEGDRRDLPPQPAFVQGWQLPRKPDVVVAMRDRPYNVPAEGTVRYQYFVVDPGFDEDKWITAAEIIPGNRAVVHHVLVFARPPAGSGEAIIDPVRGFLTGYVPGLRVRPFPDGMAKRVAAKSQLVFQIHYTPNGSPQVDQSKIGFVFADPKKITHEVRTTSAVTRQLRIPPGAENHEVEAVSRVLPADALLLGFMPHMHVRGKSFQYQAVFADGSKETMLDVPRFDFNWQTSYRLIEPRKLPAGMRMHCVAHFDNSENNPSNPDPKATVRWGDQTWNEMMIGYFDIAVPRQKIQ